MEADRKDGGEREWEEGREREKKLLSCSHNLGFLINLSLSRISHLSPGERAKPQASWDLGNQPLSDKIPLPSTEVASKPHKMILAGPSGYTRLPSTLLLLLLSCFSRVWPCADPMDSSPPGSFVHRILQARILEWVAISFSSTLSHLKSEELRLTWSESLEQSQMLTPSSLSQQTWHQLWLDNHTAACSAQILQLFLRVWSLPVFLSLCRVMSHPWATDPWWALVFNPCSLCTQSPIHRCPSNHSQLPKFRLFWR